MNPTLKKEVDNKLLFNEAANIEFCLMKLSEQPLPISYQIAKNLKKLQTVLKPLREIANDLAEKHIKKDAKDKFMFEKNKKGEVEPDALPIFLTEKDKETYNTALKLLQNDEVSIEFHKIFSDSIDGQMIVSRFIFPLLDRIIFEKEEKK
jgi:hypothetical protein